jgi:hypothetical protein
LSEGCAACTAELGTYHRAESSPTLPLVVASAALIADGCAWLQQGAMQSAREKAGDGERASTGRESERASTRARVRWTQSRTKPTPGLTRVPGPVMFLRGCGRSEHGNARCDRAMPGLYDWAMPGPHGGSCRACMTGPCRACMTGPCRAYRAGSDEWSALHD